MLAHVRRAVHWNENHIKIKCAKYNKRVNMSRLFYVPMRNVGPFKCAPLAAASAAVVYALFTRVCSSNTFTHYSKCFHSSECQYIVPAIWWIYTYIYSSFCACMYACVWLECLKRERIPFEEGGRMHQPGSIHTKLCGFHFFFVPCILTDLFVFPVCCDTALLHLFKSGI